MNDRFKFRYWHTKENKYINTQCDCLAICNSCLQSIRDIPDVRGWYNTVLDQAYNDFELIPEQCTGLKDKNGNLIYENDRITIRHETGKICFGFYRKTEEHFTDGIYGWYIEWDNPNCWLRQDLGYFIGEGIEIIGNIHNDTEAN